MVPIVFLSHSARDADVARRLKEVLATHTKGEIEWWLSSDGQSIRGGKNWRSEVEQALRGCKLVFILFTATASQSAWVQYEAGFADALNKDIVPIALPGFDIDRLPGPLQHKQGFNLRGASGLNNMLSLTNQVLSRHDLLSLADDAYNEVFATFGGQDRLPQLLDMHLDEVKLEAESNRPIIAAMAAKARELVREELVESTADGRPVLAGPGFVLREQRKEAPAAEATAGTKPSEPRYRLKGEMVASAFLEMLPAFAASKGSEVLPAGGWITCALRPGSALLTNQSRILSQMRSTPFRFVHDNVFSFENITFTPRSYDANESTRPLFAYIRSRIEPPPPEPYKPKDMRYEFLVQWDAPCPAAGLRELLTLLVARGVIFHEQR